MALQAPALRTNVDAAWEDPGHTSASMGLSWLVSEISPYMKKSSAQEIVTHS